MGSGSKGNLGVFEVDGSVGSRTGQAGLGLDSHGLDLFPGFKIGNRDAGKSNRTVEIKVDHILRIVMRIVIRLPAVTDKEVGVRIDQGLGIRILNGRDYERIP